MVILGPNLHRIEPLPDVQSSYLYRERDQKTKDH